MRKKQCKHCGAVFDTDKQFAYLCPACALQSRRNSVYRERVCMDCGAVFMGYPKSKRCPSCAAAAKRRRDANQKRSGPARPLGSTDLCQNCGKEYIVVSGMQRYCKDCAAEATLSNVRSHKRAYNDTHKDTLYPAKTANRSYNKVCLVCGSVFDSDEPTVTCSPACAAALRKLRQEEADIRRGRRKTPAGVKYDSGLPKSGVTGVTARRNGKWMATWERHYIGVFDTIEAAAAAIEQYKEDHPNDTKTI